MSSSKRPTDGRALSRSQFVRLLNASRYAQQRKLAGLRENIITQTAVGKWITEQGCPVNQDGKTLSMVDVAAWLVVRYKEGLRDKPGGSTPADGEALADQMREHVEAGDVVGLIGCLMGYCDLETAQAVSKIVVNVITAEKGRVKAQADEYERRIRAGELIEKLEVEKGYVARAKFIRETLENLGNYAPRLQGKNLSEIRVALDEIGRDVCRRLTED